MSDIGVAELPGLARARGLTAAGNLLESIESALGEMEPIDAALLGAGSRDSSVNLSEMARRGLDSSAAACLTFLDGRLERGLLAWDLLSESLRPIDDEEGTARLQQDAGLIAGALPPIGTRCVRVSAAELSRFVTKDDTDAPLAAARDAANRGELAAIVDLFGRGGDARAVVESPSFRETFTALARRLDVAHVSTVASAYWRFAAEFLRDRDASAALVETCLDAGDEPEGDLDPPLAAYRAYRAAVSRNDSAGAIAAFRTARQLLDSPRAQIICVDMEALTEPAAALEKASQVASSCREWRFAARVLLRVTLLAGDSPIPVLDDYLARFGNDYRVWLDIVSRAPTDATWVADVRSRALREVYALPHDSNAWRALGQVLGEPFASTIDAEVTQRLSAQCAISR